MDREITECDLFEQGPYARRMVEMWRAFRTRVEQEVAVAVEENDFTFEAALGISDDIAYDMFGELEAGK